MTDMSHGDLVADPSGTRTRRQVCRVLVSACLLWLGIRAPHAAADEIGLRAALKTEAAQLLERGDLAGYDQRATELRRTRERTPAGIWKPCAKVHCHTMFDTMLDTEMLAAGHANPRTGAIGIQHPWCGTLMAYLRHPNRASEMELESLDIFTHESMHIRGEMNEARTECEAVQRNYRAAKLLGVPDSTAKQNALDYYNISYQQRGIIGGLQAAYYSDQCAPGKAMDEHLVDSTWSP